RLRGLGQFTLVAHPHHEDVGGDHPGCASSVPEGERATGGSVLHADDHVAGQEADVPPSRLKELEVVETVVNALQQDRRYAVARQPLLGKEDIALFRSQGEKVIAIGRVEELVGEGRLVQWKEIRAVRDPDQLGWKMRNVQ